MDGLLVPFGLNITSHLGVVLDFDGATEIGPAFADEIFRVYHQAHPTEELVPMRMLPAVEQMVERARRQAAETMKGGR